MVLAHWRLNIDFVFWTPKALRMSICFAFLHYSGNSDPHLQYWWEAWHLTGILMILWVGGALLSSMHKSWELPLIFILLFIYFNIYF